MSTTTRLLRLLRRLWFPLAITLLYIYTFPYFERIRSANELPRIYLAMAIVDRGAFDIGPELAAHQATPDTSHCKGKLYSNKAPGASLLAVPGYALLSALEGHRLPLRDLFFWLRLTASTLPSLLFLWLIARLLTELLPRQQAVRRLVLAAYALGSMAFVYGTLLFAHQLAAALIGSAFIIVFLYSRTRTGRWALLWAGLCAGGAVLVDYQAAFIGPPLFVYLLYKARPRLRCALLFCAGAALPLGFLLFYHWVCFDSPFATGYQHLSNPTFAQWTSRGFLGLDAFQPGRWVKRHFSPDEGLFYYSPFLLLALPGLALMARRHTLRAEAIFCGAVLFFFFYFIGALVLISGWDVGPRYVIVALPFYLMPIAVLFRRVAERGLWVTLPAGLAVLSIGIYLAVGAVFPHFPDNFSDPLFDLTWRFGAAGYLPYNLGWALGLRGVPSVLPYAGVALALLLAVLLGLQRGWRRYVVTAGALLIAVAMLVGYRSVLRYRQQPVPYSFLPWMERIWEPRHDKLDKAALPRRIGPAPRLAGPAGPEGSAPGGGAVFAPSGGAPRRRR